MDYFSQIPRELFYITKNKVNNNGLIKQFGNDNLLLIIDYLFIHTNRYGVSYFTIEDMMRCYNLKIDRHTNKSLSIFKQGLNKLIENNYIKLITNSIVIDTIQKNQFVECELHIYSKVEKGKHKGEDNNYIQLFQADKEKILQYNIDKSTKEQVDNIKLLIYYCYLKARMYRRSKEDGDRIKCGGKNEVCYPSFATICDDINITDKIIVKYNKILVDLDLIRYSNGGLWYYKDGDKKALRESNNTYILYQDGWETELKDAIKFYKEKNADKTFVEKNYKNNDKAINGYIGRINYLEGEGRASPEQIKKRDTYLEMKNKNIEEEK